MSLRVDRVASKRDLHRFVTLPWEIYRDDPAWVPPLIGDTKKLFDREHHPFYEHGDVVPFLATRGGKPVGRIAAIRNTAHERFHEESVGFFGFFECVNDPAAASALVDEGRAYMRERNLPRFRGPMNPSTNEECGVLVDGFEHPPRVMMTHSPPYYDALLTGAGLAKCKDLVAYTMEDGGTVPDRLERGVNIVLKRNPGVVFRDLNMKDYANEVRRFQKVYNQAWEKNWGFVPMTAAEIEHMAKELKRVIDPGLVRFAERDGEPVGFALALPDVNQALKHANGRLFPLGLLKILWHARKINRVRVIALGLVPEMRRSGLDIVLYRDLFTYGTGKGYHTGEFSWILEDNVAMRRPMESIGDWVYKTYRIYEAPVAGR